jgi:hypothetical protein
MFRGKTGLTGSQTRMLPVKPFSPNGSDRSPGGLAATHALAHSGIIVSTRRPHTLVLATVILWTVAYAAWTAGWMLDPMPFALERALRRIPLCAGGALLCLAIGRWLDHTHDGDPWHDGMRAAIAVLLATTAFAFANELTFYVIAPRWGGAAWAHIPDVMMTDFWVYAAWALLYFALAADAARRDREVRLAQANTAAIDAQHRMLLQQVNPHFLFNALNTVYALVLDGDNAGARRSLLALSAFLRDSIDGDPPAQVPLSKELEAVRHYLDIELARFGDRLRLQEAIPDALLDRPVPRLILQPLVENCIKHGLNGSTGTVTIRLSATEVDDDWMLEVEDDGRGTAGTGTPVHGVGLDNVARRLALLYGDGGRLHARARTDGGFVASIHLPGDLP